MTAPQLYVAGDIHYAGGSHPILAWLDELAQRPPARLVLLGDVVEWWVDSGGCCARYAPLLDRLRALRARRWTLDIVRGNRELIAGRRFAVASGARLHWPRLELALGGRRIRIEHGDRLLDDPLYRGWSALARSLPFRVWSSLHPPALQEAVARWLRQHSAGRRPGRRIRLDPRRLAASARGVDALLFGHIHACWRRQLGGCECILVGDWPAGEGRWVEGYADGRLAPRRRRWP